jgi:hypothetical protein
MVALRILLELFIQVEVIKAYAASSEPHILIDRLKGNGFNLLKLLMS